MLNISGPVGGLALVGVLAAVVVGTAGIWATTFEKAGLSGSNAVAPHLFTYAMIQMAGLRNWKIPRLAFLLGPFLPFLMCYVPFGVARRFGKSRLFGLGLLALPFVFFPILGSAAPDTRRPHRLDQRRRPECHEIGRDERCRPICRCSRTKPPQGLLV